MTQARIWDVSKIIEHGAKLWQPEDILNAAKEYFEWAEENEIIDKKAMSTRDGVEVAEVGIMRPLTMRGFLVHAGIPQATWYRYKKEADYAIAVQFVENVIFNNKLEGGLTGVFAPSVVIRDLGLKDTIHQEIDAKTVEYSPEDYKKAQKKIDETFD